jgi:hypothetical protein
MQYRPSHSWGPALWSFLHSLTVIDMENSDIQISDSKQAITILKQLPAIIPCHKCAHHYQEFFHTNIEGRERYKRMELFDLFVEYHNQINQKLGKKIMTIEEARLRWTNTI